MSSAAVLPARSAVASRACRAALTLERGMQLLQRDPLDDVKGVDHIAQGLGHLAALRVPNLQGHAGVVKHDELMGG